MNPLLIFILFFCVTIPEGEKKLHNSAYKNVSQITYREITIDTTGLSGFTANPDSLLNFFKSQVDVVWRSKLKDRLKDSIVPLSIKVTNIARFAPAYCSRQGEILIVVPVNPRLMNNPVLLHEMMHVYHFKLGEDRMKQITKFYEEAKAEQLFPLDSYCMSNEKEYFAVMASIMLHGNIPRPPFDAESIIKAQPQLAEFLKETLCKKQAP